MYWKILAARLTFVVIFENIVVFVMIIVKWCIPDVPRELRDQIRRENYVTNEIIIKQEMIRAQSGHLCKYKYLHLIVTNKLIMIFRCRCLA